MVLGEVVGLVVLAGLPMHAKLSLLHSIPNPVEAHIHGFGALCLDSVVGDSLSSGIVSLNQGGGPLWVAHFLECVANHASFLSI